MESSTNLKIEYCCARCDVNFPTKSHLLGHMSVIHYTHQGQKFSYECPTCGFEHSQLARFNRHLLVHQQPQFKCSKCPKTYRSNRSLTAHSRNQHGIDGRQSYTCKDCGKNFTELRSLTVHSLTHKPPQFPCNQCGRKCFSMPGLLLHIKTVHLRSTGKMTVSQVACDQCPMKFTTAFHLKAHLANIHQPKDHKCPHCYREFATLTELNNHLLKAHSVVDSDFKCQICHKTFRRQAGLVSHSRFHGNPTHSCGQCPFKFYSLIHLSQHVKLRHSVKFAMPWKRNSEEVLYACAICCRPFGLKKENLRMHLKIHYQNPLVCPDCQQVFNSDVTFKAHMRQKHRKQIRCDICSKAFISQARFLTHRKFHEKPTVACPHCPQLFYTDACLFSHSRSHNSEAKKYGGKYECAMCLRTFPFRGSLRVHLQTHNSLLYCTRCEFQTRSENSLRRHLQNFH